MGGVCNSGLYVQAAAMSIGVVYSGGYESRSSDSSPLAGRMGSQDREGGGTMVEREGGKGERALVIPDGT